MATSFDPIKLKTYETNVRFLAQQRFSKLRTWCNDKPTNTAKHSFRVVSPRTDAMNAKAGARQATQFNDTTFANRVAIPSPKDTADSYEWDDVVRMSTDPNSVLTQQQAAQCGREIDDMLLTAMFANALDEDGNPNAFPAGQQIGGALQAFDIALVRQVNAAFKKNEVFDEQRCWVISPDIEAKMLAWDQVVNSEFMDGRPLADGTVARTWMGFTWLVHNRLQSPGGTQIYMPVFTRKAMGAVFNKDIFTEIDKDPGLKFATVVYTAFDAGAVRVQDEQIFRVHVDEAL